MAATAIQIIEPLSIALWVQGLANSRFRATDTSTKVRAVTKIVIKVSQRRLPQLTFCFFRSAKVFSLGCVLLTAARCEDKEQKRRETLCLKLKKNQGHMLSLYTLTMTGITIGLFNVLWRRNRETDSARSSRAASRSAARGFFIEPSTLFRMIRRVWSISSLLSRK